MISSITHTRRPLWLKAARPAVVWWLRAWIKDEEKHLVRLRYGGVFTDEQLAQRELNLGPIRALLIWWEAA